MNKARKITLNEGTGALRICNECGSTIIFGRCGFCEEMARARAKATPSSLNLWKEINRFYVYCLITCLASAVIMVLVSML